MSHLDGERGRQRRHASPLGRPAAPAGVEIANVDRARHHEVSTTGAGNLALSGADRNARLAARRGHVEAVVLPAHRLFEPANVEIGRETGKFDGLSQCPALVGVDDKDKVIADRLARNPHALRVFRRSPAADLEFAAGVTLKFDLLHLAAKIGERLALLVIAGDADRRQAIGIAAPELVKGRVERLADGVPESAVDASLRAHRELPVAQDVGARLAHELPAALDVESVLADQQRLDLIEDDLDDFALRFEFISVVDLADDSRRGVHPGNDGAAMRHEVVAAAKCARQRHAERHAFNAFDPQLRRHRMPNLRGRRKAMGGVRQGQGGRRMRCVSV